MVTGVGQKSELSTREYVMFLDSKRIQFRSSGRAVDDSEINAFLFPFQRDLTRWAIRKGRAAIYGLRAEGGDLFDPEGNTVDVVHFAPKEA